jgi:CelD/BcsL family acetyltransferase involved in cellulose biosynthesis
VSPGGEAFVSSRSTFDISIVKDGAGLAALREDWRVLLAASAAPEIFQTHEWMSTWWDVFGGGPRELFIVTVRDAGRLVGLAPFQIRTIRRLGPTRLQRLEFIGTGEPEADEVCSDFLDVVVAPGYAEPVCVSIWAQLVAARGAWDEAIFTNVLGRSVMAQHLRPLARPNARSSRTEARSERFFIDLTAGDFDAYLERLSKKRRKRLAYSRRRLEKEGQLTEQRLQRSEDIPMFLAEIARLNRLRRSSQKKSSAFESERFRLFHALLAPRLWELGALDLRLWWRDGQCVAALYNLLHDGTIYYYQSGFDTAAFGNLSPGLVTLVHTIEWGFNNACRRFDFQVGSKGGYKEEYACQTEPTVSVSLYNDSAAGHVMRSARDLRQVIRSLRARYVKPPVPTQ